MKTLQFELWRIFVSMASFAFALGTWRLLGKDGVSLACGLLWIGGAIGFAAGLILRHPILGALCGTSGAFALILWNLLNVR